MDIAKARCAFPGLGHNHEYEVRGHNVRSIDHGQPLTLARVDPYNKFTPEGVEQLARLFAAAPRLLKEWEEARMAIRGLLDKRAARESAYRDAVLDHARALLARMDAP